MWKSMKIGNREKGFEMQVSDGDHIDRLISCLYMALPFFVV
ncbi:hypothetical protein CK203_025693 [Vitis vinifera]|uniref:Uncharacterized protein n=1 Tax=Vitis vinifera TaxID=29760 RepID=A0A438IGB5_VITVI|nr:hypothetical protein CK203_025693 [Vitis vinifera]